MVLFPNAKINLGLHILSKREDNYHNLETIMHPIGLCDILEFLPAIDTEFHFRLTGIHISGETTENLVYKAYTLLKDKYHLPQLKIHLHKMIPSGAGLGGGSSDAAFMLKGLNQMFDLKLSNIELQEYAAILGSDCSFFIENVPALTSGRGEILTPVNNFINNYRILLFFPEFPVSTKEAYNGITPNSERKSLLSLLEAGIANWKLNLRNDFEKTIFEKYPLLGTLKDSLYENGAVYVSMTGSGSAVYGIFENEFILPEKLRKYLIWMG